ncbi:amino acid adenylation domain-containing protein [Pseudoalteromonas obscura]|uniref:Amino acid adenylation domain-containing protein n=1 Tax=Pseudoalteromonas obscura TaxID=3048491 RepID=A0ABT7EJY4_9GAMM|nr:amino acid adenylation domain-containing protein [Pseudoalteromonas sp. P94(2023)]MDK2595354.1 amino acid adenylation domain-containing protein [Pseudoalteromonas sp. P94(2023)]
MKILSDVLHKGLCKGGDNALAVADNYESYSYGDLSLAVTQIAVLLQSKGVKAGDRVGIWADKSCRALAAMLAVSKMGGVYVPIDPMNPMARVDIIRTDCTMKAMFTTQAKLAQYRDKRADDCLFVVLDGEGELSAAATQASDLNSVCTWHDIEACQPSRFKGDSDVRSHDLAYMLYTSGSTGVPKGVRISHANALAFVQWVIDKIKPIASDRFSNHAPWHFDLSVLDIYVALATGASVHLVSELDSYVPKKLVNFIAEREITIWYSVPTALTMMMNADPLFGKKCKQLHTIIFAGEAFDTKSLTLLREHFPLSDLFNFYGPTETNVCSYFKVPDIVPEELPIGYAASGARIAICDQQGKGVDIGERGFITVVGPTVFDGYWGKELRQQAAYNTGDIGYINELGELMYVGRQDHMVKVKGYRVHLGEVERALYQHPEVKECLVELDEKKNLIAHIACGSQPPSLLTLKMHCAKRLPKYMLPEHVVYWDALPRNRNGKLSRRSLSETRPRHGSKTVQSGA